VARRTRGRPTMRRSSKLYRCCARRRSVA
jgi:hypothetical protein